MIRCIAIDDEPLALRQLQGYISRTDFLHLERSFTSAVEARHFLEANPVDLMFVDVDMPDVNGLDFVRSLDSEGRMVIFTTAYAEYAVEGFKLSAVDYLLKPFSFSEFSRAATKAKTIYELFHREEKPDKGPLLEIRADHKNVFVHPGDVVYVESEGEYVRLHLDNGTKLTTHFRLKNMEELLPREQFMRVHRGYIVNMERIQSFGKKQIVIAGEEIPIGDSYRGAFSRAMKGNSRKGV